MLASGYVDWSGLGQILGIGLLAGAGLVAVFSFGLVALSLSGYERGTGSATTRNPMMLTGALLCFLVVLGGVAYGINVMLAK